MKTTEPGLTRRRLLRWASRLAVAFPLALALILLYLNQVGLPDFAKIRLQSELQARGWNVEVDRLRWQPLKRQLLAEVVQWRANSDDLRFSARKLEIHLRSWFAFPPEIKAITVRSGSLDWLFSASEDAFALQATNVQAKLSFSDPHYWEVESSAQCMGIDIDLQAQVTNVAAFKNRRSQAETAGRRNILRQIVQTSNSLGLAGNPSLQIRLKVDAAHPQKSTARIELLCDRAELGGLSLEAENIRLYARWEAPSLVVEQLAATLYDGSLDFQGTWNAKTGRTTLAGRSDFDVQRIGHLLSDRGRRWLSQYEFQKPPFAQIQGNFILPKWNGDSGWWRELQSSLNLAGRFHADKASFRAVPLDSVSSSVEFSNRTWRLPDIRIARPEGELRLNYQCDTRTKDHRWEVDGVANLNAYKPLLSSAQKERLALFEFTQPLHIRNGKVRGRWGVSDFTQLETSIAATNFLFRGAALSSLRADLAYTNQLLTATHVELDCQEGQIRAESAKVDFDARLVTTANAVSTASPETIAKMIGPSTEQFFKRYRFPKPPRIQVNGVVPFDEENPAANARFQVRGHSFAFGRFQTPYIRADVNWIDQKVEIENVDASFYQGSLQGSINLPLANRRGAFHLRAKVENADLNALFADLLLEEGKESQGILNGEITIDSGRTDNWEHWQGHGQVSLEKGFLWDAPLFGIFSHFLNALSPGLGGSRAESGQASFTIVDGVLHTSDLTIQEPSARLRYQGKIDFEGNLDAKVEAELLRDIPMIGQVVSTALWPVSKLFVYKVSGNLRDPVVEPKYMLPKLLMKLMDPIHSILNPSRGIRRNFKPAPPEPAATD